MRFERGLVSFGRPCDSPGLCREHVSVVVVRPLVLLSIDARVVMGRSVGLARAALRSWVADVVDREPAERGMAFVVDRLEAEAIAGGPPSDEELAPYRAAADAVALEVFVSALARELESIRQAVGA
jgi:hypothetical protein